MIIKCKANDFQDIYDIINDAAKAYKGVIPPDRYHEPYMSVDDLNRQLNEGVEFWAYVENDTMNGVMGIQDKGEVTLIRHAYVRNTNKNQGIGSSLLQHLLAMSTKPVLIGTWADAYWAIRFYEKHGFHLLPENEKDLLLAKYWNIPVRQAQTSVVLSNNRGKNS